MSELLDACGLKCPLPVLKARKRMQTMAAGALLEVLATDPKAPEDFAHFCSVTGNRLVDIQKAGDIYHIKIERAA